MKNIIKTGALPVALGGDDSIPIAVLNSYQDEEPFYVLQLTHILIGVMTSWAFARIQQQLPVHELVSGIIQVGARGVGSARREEHQAAMDYGAQLIPARDFHRFGVQSVLDMLPNNCRVFLTIDFDVLDPAIMPAVGAPTPGGLYYQETIDLIHAAANQFRVLGACRG